MCLVNRKLRAVSANMFLAEHIPDTWAGKETFNVLIVPQGALFSDLFQMKERQLLKLGVALESLQGRRDLT